MVDLVGALSKALWLTPWYYYVCRKPLQASSRAADDAHSAVDAVLIEPTAQCSLPGQTGRDFID